MTRILCLYTGGTIGCLPTEQGLSPARGALTKPIADLASNLPNSPDVVLQEYSQLLDSSCMGPTDWNRIGTDIMAQYADFDGFVILHGTDTLAYTAAALSFQLENLSKPVLITGSQRPWFATGSDAPANVTSALKSASGDWPGVRVAFGGRLLPGTRVRKMDADHDHAFYAPNWNGLWPENIQLPHPPTCITVDPHAKITGIKLYPGFNYDWLSTALNDPLQAIVLETYGSGNLPEHSGLIAALKKQAASGALIINCSQCPTGHVKQGHYASSHVLGQIGALPAQDMSPEAALAKLYYLFATTQHAEDIGHAFMHNLRGEIAGKSMLEFAP